MRNIKFINAGAGSGKTHKLTRILTQNLSQGICRGDQVILTTFTRKAADEFRSRARESLLSAGLTEEADLLASAAMGTVHSVASQLIRKYWYHLGIGVEVNIMPDEDVDFFLNQALANIPTSQEIAELNRIARQFNFSDIEGKPDPDRWRSDLSSVINDALTNGIANFDDSLLYSENLIDQFYVENEFEINFDLVRSTLNEIAESLEFEPDLDKKVKAEKSLAMFVDQPAYDFVLFNKLETFLRSLPGQTGQLDSVMHLRNLTAQPNRYPGMQQMMRRYQKLLFDLAERSLAEFRTYKDQNKLLDYTDMEVKFLELMSDVNIRDDIARTYKQVYVDEFQDSSPIQVEIFVKLSDIVEQSWWVGDPKQSIYSFRGTDPVLIKSIVDTFENGDQDGLQTENLPMSWRTRPEIVEFHGKFFTDLLASQVHDRNSIALSPVRTGNSFQTGGLEYPLLHWHMALEGKFTNVKFHNCLIGGISEFLDSGIRVEDKGASTYNADDPSLNIEILRDALPGDIAVLRRTNDSVSSLAGALRESGLEVAAYERGLNLTAEVILFTSMLKYLLDAGDTNAKAMILVLGGSLADPESLLDDRLAYINDPEAPVKPASDDTEEMDDENLQYFQYERAWRSEDKLLQAVDELRQNFSFFDISVLVELLVYSTGLPDLVARWKNAEQRRNNLLTIIKLAGKYDEHCVIMKIGASVNGFLQYMKDLPSDMQVQSPSSGKNAINMTTYHKSKGLEWPIVVLLDLNKHYLSEKDIITKEFHGVHIEAEGDFSVEEPLMGRKIALLPSPLGKKGIPENLKEIIKASDRYGRIETEAYNEHKRLLYVGMTRARDYLVTVSSQGQNLTGLELVSGLNGLKNQAATQNPVPSMLDLFKTGKPFRIHHMPEIQVDDDGEQVQFLNRIHLKPDNPPLENDPKYRNPSSEPAPEGTTAAVLDDFNIRITQFMENREDELGNCLHSIFYHYNPDAGKEYFLETARRIRDQYGLKEDIPDIDQVYKSISRLFHYLAEKYGGPLEVRRELPMQVFRDGYILRGEADLVWETEEGIILLDYKSFPGSRTQLLDAGNKKHFAGHYGGQLKAYKEMIEASHPGNKKVLETLIYYSVIGLLVKLEF